MIEEAIAIGYTLLGSSSFGYLFLRFGWPSLRTLEQPYKIGWSIVLGIVFTAIVSLVSFFIYLSNVSGYSFAQYFLSITVLAFFLTAILLTLKRKLYVRKRIKVSYPKDYWTAVKTVEKVEGKILDEKFVKVKGMDEKKLKELRKKLKR